MATPICYTRQQLPPPNKELATTTVENPRQPAMKICLQLVLQKQVANMCNHPTLVHMGRSQPSHRQVLVDLQTRDQ